MRFYSSDENEVSHVVPFKYVELDETSKRCDETVSVLRDIVDHPYRASLKTMWPGFVNRLVYGSYKKNIFDLAKHLCLMGLDDHVIALLNILESNDHLSDAEKLQNALNHLYRLFDFLSSDQRMEGHAKSLQKLKKMIHQFARDNEMDCRLFNLQRLEAKLAKELDTAAAEERLIIEKQIKRLEWIRKYSNQKYAYISDSLFQPVSTEQERNQRRRAKFVLNGISLAVSVIVGIGEGLVAAVFMMSALPLLPAILLIGIPAATCNFFLFRAESYEILKDIYFGRIWTKPDGKPLSKLEKGFVIGSLLFSFGAAAAFGFLSFGSAISGFTALFAAIGIATGPVGIMVVAAFVAIVTTVALFTIFSYMTVNWVRNDGPRKLLNTIRNLPSAFVNFWKHEQWSTLKKGEKVSHVAKKVIEAFCNTLFFALAVAAVVIVNVATTGLFKHKSATIFQTVFGVAPHLANILSWVIVVGLGAVVNWIFYARGTVKVLNALKSIGSAIIHPVRTFNHIKENWDSIKSSPVRIFNTVATSLKRLFLFGCIASNTYGQMNGVKHDPVAVNWVHGITRLDPSVVSELNRLSMIGGSGGPNAIAAVAATSTVPVIEIEMQEMARSHSDPKAKLSSNPEGLFVRRQKDDVRVCVDEATAVFAH